MIGKIKERIKKLLSFKDESGFFIVEDEVINSVKCILLSEKLQINAMRNAVLEGNKYYKINLSQFYFTKYTTKGNDHYIQKIKNYLVQSSLLPYEDLKLYSNMELVLLAVRNIDIKELNKNRVEKFIIEFTSIIEKFKLNDSNAVNLLDKESTKLFDQYVDSFNIANKKIELHLS